MCDSKQHFVFFFSSEFVLICDTRCHHSELSIPPAELYSCQLYTICIVYVENDISHDGLYDRVGTLDLHVFGS